MAILVNESTNSAAEMVAALALEKRARRKVGRRKLALVPLTLLFFDLLFSKALRSLYCESIRSTESIQSIQVCICQTTLLATASYDNEPHMDSKRIHIG